MITLQQCIDAWNAQADDYNQWIQLSPDERVEWCLEMCERYITEVLGSNGIDPENLE